MKNMFKTKTAAESNDELIRKVEAIKDIEVLRNLGRDIVSDERYIRYRQEMEKVFGQVLVNLINYNSTDNDVYAVNMRVVVQQLRDFLAFLEAPKNWMHAYYQAQDRGEIVDE